MMVGKLISLWYGRFSGSMLNFPGVVTNEEDETWQEPGESLQLLQISRKEDVFRFPCLGCDCWDMGFTSSEKSGQRRMKKGN